MNQYMLRNHIPISGPATREPLMGDEPVLRVSLGFIPRWYHERLGIDFSEIWHTDPLYRYDTLVKMKTCLHELFPSVPNFKTEFDSRGIEKTCATISGVHGIKLIPMIYGLDVKYSKDDWPDNLAGQFLSKEQLLDLKPFDVSRSPVVIQLMEQMNVIEKNFGPIHGYLNYQGILNVAIKLRGTEIFTDMIDDPDFAHHLFGHIADTIMQVSKLVQERQRKSGFDIDLLSMSNCVMNMISPDLYREFVLPCDAALSKEYRRFGIHTCNWNITPYIEVLREIDKMGYIDMGMMSDMKKVKDVFSDARRAVFYPPMELEQKSIKEIEKDIEKIYRELSPCDIVMADVTNTTEDEKVRQFLDLAARIGK